MITRIGKQAGFLVKLLALAAMLALAVTAAGCGDDDKPEANGGGGAKTYEEDQGLGDSEKTVVDSDKEFNAQEQEVVDRIAEFSDATDKKQYKKICEEMLSEAAQKLGGNNCPDTLKKTGAQIKDFKVTVKNVTVEEGGKSATVVAKVDTESKDGKKQSAEQTLPLKKEKGEWRISVLGQ